MKNGLLSILFAVAISTSLADVTKGEFGAKLPGEVGTKSAPPSASESESPKTTKRNSYPFHGRLDSVDSSGKSLTLAGKQKPRVILLTSNTRFYRNGAKVKLSDAIAGERVTGTLRKNSAGQEEAITVRFGGTTSAGK